MYMQHNADLQKNIYNHKSFVKIKIDEKFI